MAVPARESAAARDPAEPEGRPGPLFWAGIPDTVIANARTAALVAGELARDPGNGAAMAMAGLLAASLKSLAGVAGRLADAEEKRAVDEAVHEQELKRAYDDGYEACKAARCRLAAVPGAG